ncbi:cellulose binding domain-containing protein [Nonomuraea sp. NPDC003201]
MTRLIACGVTKAMRARSAEDGPSRSRSSLSAIATIAAGAAVTFGFQATYSGTNSAPTQFALNGTACTLAT